jgi:hypothetical protein
MHINEVSSCQILVYIDASDKGLYMFLKTIISMIRFALEGRDLLEHVGILSLEFPSGLGSLRVETLSKIWLIYL